MTTFYLDHVGGNDANVGTSFGNRWKTFAAGATAARTAPGDTIRVMASPDETSLGINATWTQDSKTVTLASALTANISDCETAWVASTNVTTSANSSNFKEGTKSASIAIGSTFTTGLAAYSQTGGINLSTYKQVSFWIKTDAAIPAGTFSLRLCSDNFGGITVNTIAIPALPNTFGYWVCVTVDKAAALGATIGSVALYCDLDPGVVTVSLDNILACKDSTSANSLTLKSLIGKVHNLAWAASTAYAANTIRKPKQPNRNGFRYKVTAGGGGNSGASEPTWPLEIGKTVVDGALTWTCEGLEDTWYPIQSINGTVVKLDTACVTLGNSGQPYGRVTEVVATYKREPLSFMGVNGITANLVQESGTDALPIIYSGGWNRTDMSTQTGETWLDSQCGLGNIYEPLNWVHFYNLNGVRADKGVNNITSSGVRFFNCHMNGHTTVGFDCVGTSVYGIGTGVCANNNGQYGVRYGSGWAYIFKRITTNGNGFAGGTSANGMVDNVPHVDWHAEANGQNGVQSTSYGPLRINNLVTRGNPITGLNVAANAFLTNASCTDSTPFTIASNYTDYYVYSKRNNQTADNHLITTDGGTIISATDQRHTASGYSWKFRPTSAVRVSSHPLRLSLGVFNVVASTLTTASVWVRRDATDINGQLLLIGGQIPGVGADVSVICSPAVNTWVQYTFTFTPTESGTVELYFLAWDGVGTTNNLWIQDFAVA